MSPKQNRLLREIAALFVKYDLKDWNFVLRGLLDNESESKQALADLIRQFAQPQGHTISKGLTRKAATTSNHRVVRASKEVSALKSALSNREALPTQASLRDFATAVGYKHDIPPLRSVAINEIISFLSANPNPRLQEILHKASKESQTKADFNDEFARWAAVILNSEKR